jgi:hypothetical protein
MLTTALIALSLLADPPRQAHIQCEARILWPGVVFLGVGDSEAEARASALESCHVSGHTVCFITGCEEL